MLRYHDDAKHGALSLSGTESATQEPSEAAIRGVLERILSHAPFKRSPVLSRFLEHVVEHALGADAPPLKEYAIGLEVFDRPDDFDPRIDTIVRVQARRLRGALTRYYKGPGQQDTLRLTMPKGQYGIEARVVDPSMDMPTTDDDVTTRRQEALSLCAPLPAARTALIGRAVELAELAAQLVDDDVRLLTVTGVGGSGKTRLALAVAAEAADRFVGGVLFLDLSAVTERDVLLGMLADALELRRIEGRSLEQALADRARRSIDRPVLLVLDNMEGVAEHADVLGILLDATPQITVLVTSRIALRLYGELEYPLAPLRVPESDTRYDPAALAEVPAVQLFLARAAAASPRADFGEGLDTVAELCVRLDGLPLAIELVAAQAGAMGPRQMLERFTGHLDLPSNPARDAPARQRTLRRVIDWSHDLLDESARIALRRLSAFSGGFTFEGVEAVADAAGDLGDALLPAINALVAMGLIYRRSEGSEPRFSMLETLRAYGRERLNASGEADAVHKAHAAWCLVLAEEGVGALNDAQRETWLARCDLEQDNFRLALEHLLRHGPQIWALRLGHALFAYWERREKLSQGGRLLERIVGIVSPDTDPALWGKVSSFAATLVTYRSGQVAARKHFQRLLKLYRRLDDRRGEAAMLTAIGVAEKFLAEYAKARRRFAHALELCRQLGDRIQIAACLSNVAECDIKLGNAQLAQSMLSEARALFLEQDDHVAAAWCINHLGDVARASGELEQAAELYVQAEAEFSQLGERWGMARSLADRGCLALERGKLDEAAGLLLKALESFDALDHQRGMASVAVSLAALAQRAGRNQECIRLCAAAERWRADLGFSTRQDDLEYQQTLLSEALAGLEPATIRQLQSAGASMETDDVVASIQNILESNHRSAD